MDWREFIASLVDALAWPAAIATLAAIFRRPINERIRNVRRVKTAFGEFDFGLLEVRSEVDAGRGQAVDISEAALTVAGFDDRGLTALARSAPLAAVIAAHRELHAALRAVLERAGVAVPEELSTSELVKLAADKGVINAKTANAIGGLTVLRNIAGHSLGDDPETRATRALEYVQSTQAVLYVLRQPGR